MKIKIFSAKFFQVVHIIEKQTNYFHPVVLIFFTHTQTHTYTHTQTHTPGADTAPNLMGRISLRKGWLVRGPGQSPGRRRQRAAGENFFEDRLG